MRISIVFVCVAIILAGCAGKGMVADASGIELAKKAITGNCLANLDYEIVVTGEDSVEIRHKTAKARVYYSKRFRAGILMLVLGDSRTEELKGIRECAAPYMNSLLEELFATENIPKAK